MIGRARLHHSVAMTVVTVVVAGCPSSQQTAVPRLPSDGAMPITAAVGTGDAWAGRELLAPPTPMSPRALSLPRVERFELPNGLDVVAVVTEDAAMASVKLAVRAGRRHEPRDRVGLASVAAAALVRGSARRSRAKLDAAAEAVG